MRIATSFCLLLGAAGSMLSAPASAANALFAQPRATIAGLPDCPAPPAPIKRLATQSMYVTGDKSYSKIDPKQAKAREQTLAPIQKFTTDVAHFANHYVKSGGKDVKAGGCALVWLDIWAKAGAMRTMAEHESQFVRSVNLAGWALAYAQVRNLKVEKDAPQPVIDAWLNGMARDMQHHFNGLKNVTGRNNHRYWAGLAASAVAMDTGTKSLADWGLASARIGLAQITQRGALPAELTRGRRARHYHLYAAAPLVMTAAIADANGVDLYAEQDGALHRLVRFATQSLLSPSRIAELAGVQQEPFNATTAVGRQNVAWMEFYVRRFPGRSPAEAMILKGRPLRDDELGGDLTMLARSLP
ncbi:alginate lyase family protein [Stakelama flava]